MQTSTLPMDFKYSLTCSLAGLNVTANGFSECNRKLLSMYPFLHWLSYFSKARKRFYGFVFCLLKPLNNNDLENVKSLFFYPNVFYVTGYQTNV